MWLRRSWGTFLLFFTNVLIVSAIVSDKEYASMPPLFQIDDYDNCMLYGKKALFCNVLFKLHPKNPENVSEVWNVIQKVSSSTNYFMHDLLRHQICVTKRCPHIPKSIMLEDNEQYIEQLGECYSANFENMDLRGEIKYIQCETNEPLYSFNNYDLCFGVFLISFVMLVLYAWLYDAICNPILKEEQRSKTIFSKYISSFSIRQNWNRLLNVNLDDPDVKTLSCVQGIRFITQNAVIFEHTSFAVIQLPLLNPRFTENTQDNNFEMFVATGARTSLAFFFFISSWLLTYKFLLDSEGKKKVPISYLIRTFFSRYFSLTPVMILTVLFSATLLPHLSRGPIWDATVGKEYRMCRTKWWTNLIYINNFYAPFKETCGMHLWTMSVDAQFCILGLIILWFIWNNPDKIMLILGTLWVYHVSYSFFSYQDMTIFEELSPDPTSSTKLVKFTEITRRFRNTTMNLPGLIAGIAFGYAFYKYRNQKLFTKKTHVILWWILSFSPVIAVFVVPGCIANIDFLKNHRHFLFRLYYTFNKTVLLCGYCLFIFGVMQGHGGLIKKILEWPPFYVLGRLTYSAYLIHPLIQRYTYGIGRTTHYLNTFLFLVETIKYMTLSYLGATLFILFFERPIMQMTKNIAGAMTRSVENHGKT